MITHTRPHELCDEWAAADTEGAWIVQYGEPELRPRAWQLVRKDHGHPPVVLSARRLLRPSQEAIRRWLTDSTGVRTAHRLADAISASPPPRSGWIHPDPVEIQGAPDAPVSLSPGLTSEAA